MARIGRRWQQQSPLQQIPDRSLLLLLLGFMGLAAAPLLFHLDVRFIGLFYLFLLFKLVIAFVPRLQPHKLILLLLTLGGFALVLGLSKPLVSSQTGISLLLVMSGLKLLEITRRRDIQFSVLMGFFILITVFLYEDAMQMTLLLLAVAIGLFSVLIRINSLQQIGYWRLVRQAMGMALQALPFTLLLFFIFPRLQGPLWAFHSTEQKAKTGLSDSVTPGSISHLIQSRETAFRVEFDDAIPPQPQRYWRGPVMWHTDGRNWTRSAQMMLPLQHAVTGLESYSYRIFLEATDNNRLILLDLPAKAPDRAIISRDFQVISQDQVSKTKAYRGLSHTQYFSTDLAPNERRLALQLPDQVSDRVSQLAKGWRVKSATDKAIVEQALRYFREQPFVYTLRPPLLGNDPTDGFLFETRRGFCEHFATSFTLLMRLAGVPSRLVTGYLGGELNPRGDYLIVRQSDAHAWSEVWLESEGWVRIDPTAAVAPERIEQQLDLELAGDRAGYMMPRNSLTDMLLRNLHWGIDTLNMSWYRWIIGYDRGIQRSLLDQLGLANMSYRYLGMLASLIPVGLLVFYYLIYSSRTRPQDDPIQKNFNLLLKKLAAIGIEKKPTEGVMDFRCRLLKTRPDYADRIGPILINYQALRYGKSGDRDAFIRHCKDFK
jgi:transglutaminase-like putative cysteine protease